MTDKKPEVKMEDIVSLCKRRGFIFQGSDVYGGLAGTWDYGPLGVALKRNLMDLWWKMFVEDRDDMYGVDAAILMNKKVWEASGHATGFNDPMVECLECHSRLRADHIKDSQCPVCGTKDKFSEPRQFNMMFTTSVGPAASIGLDEFEENIDQVIEKMESTKNSLTNAKELRSMFSSYVKGSQSYIRGIRNSLSYLRPETAQGIFTNYKNVVDAFYPDMPFGIAQQGKAFRNEISPRDFVFRSREFEQMEIEYFVHPDDWEKVFEAWVKNVYEFLEAAGVPKTSVHELPVPAADRAHYSKRTIDFEFDFPHKRDELLGLAYRTDFDLQNIQKASGKSMEYRPKDGEAPFVPHVIEPSFGVERLLMAVLISSYAEDEVGGEKRSYLKLPAHIAPVKVAVSPLLKNKPELVKKAREVYDMLKKEFGNIMYDDNGNIGKRYRRQDEIGTPYCIVVDFDTLEDDTVTVRSRDTTKQKRIKIEKLSQAIEI